MADRMVKVDLKAALDNPAEVFDTPEEVLKCDVSDHDKAAILSRWAYDVREIAVAEEEGMAAAKDGEVAASGDSMSQRIHLALQSLPEGVREEGAPTKQGGG